MVRRFFLWAHLAIVPFLVATIAQASVDLAFKGQAFSEGGITKSEFTQVIKLIEPLFKPYAAREGRVFEIMADWKIDWPQAFARRWETDHLIVYGGIARIPGTTIDSFALTLCHEIGHLYGGEPFSDDANRLSIEGQADYWSTNECWDRVVHHLPSLVQTSEERATAAALVLGAFFAANRSIPAPRLNTPDRTVVARMLMTHPGPQCRLDTYLAGLRNEERPRCWWAP